MKYRFFLYGLLAMLISCENPVITDDEGEEEQNGNIRVNVCQLEQVPFSVLSRATVAELCSRLNYAVYTMEGARVKQINQDKSKANCNLKKVFFHEMIIAYC